MVPEHIIKAFIAKNKIRFCVECPALKSIVYMTEETWSKHMQKHLEYMAGKEDLVKRAIGAVKSNGFYRQGNYSEASFFFDYKCSDFPDPFTCLRTALKKLKSGILIISSAYPRERGIFPYEP